MQSGRGSRRSIRNSIFIGVLAGSVFSGSGAFAVDPIGITTQVELEAIGQDDLRPINGDYFLAFTETELALTAPASSTYIVREFTGTLDGRGKTLSGLTAPLFDVIGAAVNTSDPITGDPIDTVEIKDLNLVTDSEAGVSGGGTLANTIATGGTVNSVSSSGNVTGIDGYQVPDTFLYTGTVYVGGLVGENKGTIFDSHAAGNVVGTDANGGAVGGLVGLSMGNISDSTFTGAVTGERYVGGLVGGTGAPTISNSSASGTVTGINGGQGYIGGLVGGGSMTITDSHADVVVIGGVGNRAIGGLLGWGDVSVSIIDSYSTGAVQGLDDWVGGLVGYTDGSILDSYSHISGDVTGEDYVGGLVGYAGGEISNSYSYISGGITGDYYVGGLAGHAAEDITNSYSLIDGNVDGNGSVGGLVGSMDGVISNSYSRIIGSVIGDSDYVGGLVGYADSSISNSYANVTGDVTGANVNVGGLSGISRGNISNSHAIVGGTVSGRLGIGGFVGYIDNEIAILDSYFQGDVAGSFDYDGYFVGGFVGSGFTGAAISNSYSTGGVFIDTLDVQNLFAGNSYVGLFNSCAGEITNGQLTCGDGRGAPLLPISSIGANIESSEAFAIDACFNAGNPHLVSLLESYESSCNGGGGTPPPTRRDRFEREFREVLEARSPEKIEKVDGFKKEATVTKDAAIAFVEPTEKIEVAKVKAVEIAATANVRVNAKADEALQISLKSESKEPVELWVKSPDGSWLLAGVITFDKDGKAILPPLKFKNVGNYSLVLSKPTADSAKGSAPLNQTGSVLVAIS